MRIILRGMGVVYPIVDCNLDPIGWAYELAERLAQARPESDRLASDSTLCVCAIQDRGDIRAACDGKRLPSRLKSDRAL